MTRTRGAPPEPDPNGAADDNRGLTGLTDLQLVVGSAPTSQRKRTRDPEAPDVVPRPGALDRGRNCSTRLRVVDYC